MLLTSLFFKVNFYVYLKVFTLGASFATLGFLLIKSFFLWVAVRIAGKVSFGGNAKDDFDGLTALTVVFLILVGG